MIVIRKCAVCGKKFNKILRKDSPADLCSLNCKQKYWSRRQHGQPISNYAFEIYKLQQREAKKKATADKKAATQKYADPNVNTGLCKKTDCKYGSRTSGLHVCDYMLITGKRRGCPVEDCKRYEPGTRPVTQPM